MCQAETVLGTLTQVENVAGCRLREIDLGSGMVPCEPPPPESLYYDILKGKTGFAITGEGGSLWSCSRAVPGEAPYDKIAFGPEEPTPPLRRQDAHPGEMEAPESARAALTA